MSSSFILNVSDPSDPFATLSLIFIGITIQLTHTSVVIAPARSSSVSNCIYLSVLSNRATSPAKTAP